LISNHGGVQIHATASLSTATLIKNRSCFPECFPQERRLKLLVTHQVAGLGGFGNQICLLVDST